MDDQQLIAQVLAADPKAERAFYDRHVDKVYRLAYRLAGDAALAQDYTQETFVRAFDRLAQFRGEAALSTWICSICVTVSLNGLRCNVDAAQTRGGFRRSADVRGDHTRIGTGPQDADAGRRSMRCQRVIAPCS